MKAKPLLFFISLYLWTNHPVALVAQSTARSHISLCIDCSLDSMGQLQQRAKSPKDTLEFLLAYVENGGDFLSNDTVMYFILELLKLNGRLKLIEDEPYRLYYEALSLWNQKQPLQAISKMEEVITAFDQQHRKLGMYGILGSIRIYYNYIGLQEERLAFYQKKLKYYELNGPQENTAVCYHGIAGYYLYKADYNKAISFYLRAAEGFKSFSQNGYINEINISGMTYYKWGNSERVQKYLQKGYELCLKTKDNYNLRFSLLFLGLIDKQNKAYTEAFQKFEACFDVLTLPVDLDIWTILLAEKGGLLLEMNRPDEGFSIITKAISMRDSASIPITTKQGEFEGYYYLYQHYKSKGEYANAEASILKAYDLATLTQSNAQILKYRKELSQFYATNGSAELALPYALGYISLNDSVVTIQNSLNVSEYEKLQEAKENEAEVQGLEKQKQIQLNYFTASGIFLLLLVVGIFSRLQYIRKVKRQLEEKNILIEKEKLRAEQSEKFKEVFLANMSHEIRTPMNAVMGMTNLVLDSPLTVGQRTYMEGIKNSSDTLLHIINDILDLSKIEAGKIELETIDFSILDVLEQIKQTLSQKAEEKGLQFILEVEAGIPEVVIGDPFRLNQVLINLAGNAIKFTEKGKVSVIVSQDEDTDATSFSVTDTGIGIPEDKLHTVFESFSQAHSSDTRNFGGTGLGLSISQDLVELMGGHIQVESREGAGSTFFFTIDYPAGSAQKLMMSKNKGHIDGSILNGLRILVTDDNEYNRTVATDTLKSKANVDITEAANGQEAVDWLQKKDFDVILMDVQMPVMDGYQATRYIREKLDEPKSRIPIIALTASVIRSDLDKCRAAGMDDFVPKPFTVIQLLTAIAKATNREIKHIAPDTSLLVSKSNESTHVPETKREDRTDLAYLEKFCEGDRDRMRKYIRMFLDTAPGFMENLTSAMDQKDYNELSSQIHSYKTKWIMMGMSETKDLALAIEMVCRQEVPPPDIRNQVASLMKHIQDAINELSSF